MAFILALEAFELTTAMSVGPAVVEGLAWGTNSVGVQHLLPIPPAFWVLGPSGIVSALSITVIQRPVASASEPLG